MQPQRLCSSISKVSLRFARNSRARIKTGSRWSKKRIATASFTAGDHLRCEPGATLHLYAASKLQDQGPGEIKDACKAKNFVLTASYEAKESRRTFGDFEGYRIAGRKKGAESMFFVPPDGGSVDPDKLVVRWRTRPPLTTVAIFVKAADGAVIFSQTGLDGATGTLDSADLRRKLAALRDDPARNHNLAITLQAPMRTDDTIHCSLLSPR